ncbi:exopolysaccharide biosynthesis protein [Limimaricola sp. AA108-03]|uniref:exopolysaccharide biosynthesis protein n=1 Tax=Limimaricola sp. AA108-03 TaxID=3425945 RepID=UPI003D78589C
MVATVADVGRESAAPEAGKAWGGDIPNPARKRLSEVLLQITADKSRSEMTLNELMTLLKGRGRAALILLFALPNVLPAPPGLSAVLGLPLLYLCAQMMLGRMPWLPAFIGERGMMFPAFVAVVQRTVPILTRAERMLRPRAAWLVAPRSERMLGGLALILAIVVTLPIPLGNMLPAFAICLLALGVLERDGLWAGIGAIMGVAALLLSAAVVYAMLRAALLILLGAFA